MYDWRLRQGVVLVEIKGTYLLAADREARRHVRFVNRVNETGAFFWRLMSEGKTRDEIISAMEIMYDISEDQEPEADLDLFIRSLLDASYIINEAEYDKV